MKKLSLKGGNNIWINVCLKAIRKVFKVSIILLLLKQDFSQCSSGIMWGGYIIDEIGPPKYLALLWCPIQPPVGSEGTGYPFLCGIC